MTDDEKRDDEPKEPKTHRIRIGDPSEVGKSARLTEELLKLFKERGDKPIVLDPRIPDDETAD